MTWWIIDDKPSANGTFLQRNNSELIDVRRDSKFEINDGDIIFILAKLLEDYEPVFWRLKFRDWNDKTNPILKFHRQEITFTLLTLIAAIAVFSYRFATSRFATPIPWQLITSKNSAI